MPASRIGVLTRSSGTVLAELQMGRPVQIGSLTALAGWRPRTGLQLLVLMPIGRPAPEVKKAGRRQAGAFLLEPGENFCLGMPGEQVETCTFTTDPVIRLPAEPGTACGFCRAALQPNAPAFSLGSGKLGPSGRLLCRDCAAAWQVQAGIG